MSAIRDSARLGPKDVKRLEGREDDYAEVEGLFCELLAY